MGKMFWGILLIVIGVLMIIKHVFGLDLPVFKILLGLFFIYLGVKTIFGGFHLTVDSKATENTAIFSEADFQFPSSENSNDYQTIFGKGRLDLTKVDLSNGDVKIDLDAVFGKLTVIVDPKTPLVVKVNSAFGKVQLPTKDKVTFGEYTYESESAKTATAKLILTTSAVFGSLKIKNQE